MLQIQPTVIRWLLVGDACLQVAKKISRTAGQLVTLAGLIHGVDFGDVRVFEIWLSTLQFNSFYLQFYNQFSGRGRM